MKTLLRKPYLFRTAAISSLYLACSISANQAFASKESPPDSLTICWAKWDPANALKEISKTFTKQTGIHIKYELEPWTSYTARFQKSLNEKSQECDIIFGDSQWLGGAVEKGHYVKLNDFLDREKISLDGFVPATVEAYSTWPKGTKNYWAIPAMGDAVGWTYRKDWFNRRELKEEFQQTYGWSLERPRSWNELVDIANFFQGRIIDGKKVYGAAIYTEGQAEGITMGFTSAFHAWGAQLHSPNNTSTIDGFVNSPKAITALKAYRELYECCSPPKHNNSYMLSNLESYKTEQVAMHMNFFAFFPGIHKDPVVGGDKTGYFSNPEHHAVASTLGGQGASIVAHSEKRELAYEYLKWFSTPRTQKIWWSKGGYSVHTSVMENPWFPTTQPFAEEFLKAMATAKDFWQSPNYEELLSVMQKHVYQYVIKGEGTAADALNKVAIEWEGMTEN